MVPILSNFRGAAFAALVLTIGACSGTEPMPATAKMSVEMASLRRVRSAMAQTLEPVLPLVSARFGGGELACAPTCDALDTRVHSEYA